MSDILTVTDDNIQRHPKSRPNSNAALRAASLAIDKRMICLVELEAIFPEGESEAAWTRTQAIDTRGHPDEVLASGEYPLTRRDLAEIAQMIYADAGIFLNESKRRWSIPGCPSTSASSADGFREYCELVASQNGQAERREMLRPPDDELHPVLPREPSFRPSSR